MGSTGYVTSSPITVGNGNNISGSVAKKIALFQLNDDHNLIDYEQILRKKGVILRKNINEQSSSEKLAARSNKQELLDRLFSRSKCQTLSTSIDFRSIKSRRLKDSFNTFTLQRSPCFRLVEINELLDSNSDSNRIYENFEAFERNKSMIETAYEKLPLVPKAEQFHRNFRSDSFSERFEHISSEDTEIELRPPTPPPYESIYSEPIYGGSGGSTSGSSSYWSPASSLYNQSTVTRSDLDINNSPNTNTVFLNNTSIGRNGVQTPMSSPSPRPLNYNLPSELPPTPTPSSAYKLSIIAKTAGKKIAKKFDYFRRFSRASFYDDISSTPSSPDQPFSLPPPISTSPEREKRQATWKTSCPALSPSRSQSTVSLSSNGRKNRALVPRPRIPPPEPPPIPNFKQNDINDPNRVEHKIKPDEYDSDFCDSDSELIRNFVSTVQPIYSMDQEPLYQYYTYGISLQPESDYQPVIPKNLGLTLEMLVPRTGQRSLWCEIPEVQNSGILTILSDKQKQLQEAIFEILTSEVSYLKSLEVLISLFYENEDLNRIMSSTDRSALFGNITQVRETSKAFLAELLEKWKESWYIQEVGQLIIKYTKERFSIYVEYCRNKPYQDRTLQQLRGASDEFTNVIRTIECDPRCELLRMDSFLMLPMQRITRLPLLINAVIQRTQQDAEKKQCEDALKSLTDLVIECNEAAKESQEIEESERIMEKLEFPRGMRPLRNPGQFLIKGDFMKNPFDSGRNSTRLNWTFQKNSKRTYFWLILFTQKLFIAKKRSSGKLEVVEAMNPKESYVKVLPSLEGISKEFQFYFMLHFDGREAIYFLASRTESEIERWKNKLDELRNDKEPKVQAIFRYEAKREDELSFDIGEVIRVNQKEPDGWYFGTKENGNGEGWFPGNYATECS